MSILSVKNLTKKFGKTTAVDSISFDLKEGEILGMLGPNGAGKTTALQMLLGVLTPTYGEIKYFGKDLATDREQILEKINFSSTYVNLPWSLTVKENLKFISYLYCIPDRRKRLTEIANEFRLADLLSKRIENLFSRPSTRVNLAKAFINQPKILLLDEPTASLDPEVAAYIREFLLEQRDRLQTSIIITSHNMSEVEEICDRVVFINKGKIIANDTPNKLAKTIAISHLRFLGNMDQLEKYCRKNKIPHTKEGHYIVLNVNEKKIPEILQNMAAEKIEYDEISIEKPTLEDYFLQTVRQNK